MVSSDTILGIVFLILLLLLIPFFVYLARRFIRYDEQHPIITNFCSKCISETLPESCGNVSSTNFVGTTLKYLGDRCNVCNSYVAEHRLSVFGIPVKVYGKYRILSVPRESSFSPVNITTAFISRRLKDN